MKKKKKKKKTPGDIILKMCTMNDNHDVWFLRHGAQQTEHVVILDCFLLFYPTNNLQKQNFENMKKNSWDIIILHMCTINDNHIIYSSCDMEHNRKNFLSFWPIFCSLTPLTTQKIKILKKWKNSWRYYFTNVYQKTTIIWCMVPETWSTTDRIFCHFSPFYPTKNPVNQNFE